MEDLAPPLKLVFELEQNLKNGESIRVSLDRLNFGDVDGFNRDVEEFVFLLDQGKDLSVIFSRQISEYRRSLLELIRLSLCGESILDQLLSLKTQIELAIDEEIDRHLKKLPFVLLVPLFFFMVPSYLLLLFGPFIKQFYEGVTF